MTSESTTVLNQRYVLTAVLGKGGQATVYQATDRMLNVERAIKVLSPQLMHDKLSRDRFRAEAQSMAKIDHKGIVKIYDIVDTEEHFFIVMELLNGGTLWQWIGQHGAMPEKMACMAIANVVEALTSVHRQGIIHRDIKPQNMLLNQDGDIKLTDFGIARGDSSFTQTGSAIGTFGYMAPEQIENSKYVTSQSDIYSLGACLYALCIGKSPKDLVLVHHKEELLTGFSSQMRDIILKATQYQPTDRYATPFDMRKDLQAALQTLPDIPVGTHSLSVHANFQIQRERKPVTDRELRSFQPTLGETIPNDTFAVKKTVTDSGSATTIVELPAKKLNVRIIVGLAMLLLASFIFWPRQESQNAEPPISQLAQVNNQEVGPVKDICLSWAEKLASRQKDDGGFPGSTHFDSGPWDTSQQMTALMYASRCGFSTEGVDSAAKKWMKKWMQSETFPAHIYELCWALVYLANKDPELQSVAEQALQSFRLDDGTYRANKADKTASVYATVMAAWALSQSAKNEEVLVDTVRYLRKVSFTDLSVALDEQVWWVLHHIGETIPGFRPTAHHNISFARRIIERCKPVEASSACEISKWPNAAIPLRQNQEDPGIVVLQGDPWIMVASHFLAKQSLPEKERKLVQLIADWSLQKQTQDASYIKTTHGYELSENLLALSLIVESLSSPAK